VTPAYFLIGVCIIIVGRYPQWQTESAITYMQTGLIQKKPEESYVSRREADQQQTRPGESVVASVREGLTGARTIVTQSAVTAVSILTFDMLLAVLSITLVRYLVRSGSFNSLANVVNAGTVVVSLATIAGIGYLVGRYTKPKARILGIASGYALNWLVTNAYHVWTVQHISPAYLPQVGILYWVKKLFFLIIAIATQIAVAEMFARYRKKKS
jgi:hypothetical protein